MSERSSRSNRGSRLQELIKNAQEGRTLPEDEFYTNLDGEDESDNEEFDEDSSEEDEVDTDFDQEEEQVNEEAEAKVAEEIAQKEDDQQPKKKNIYVDPAKQKKPVIKIKSTKEPEKEASPFKKYPKPQYIGSDNEYEEEEEDAKEKKKKKSSPSTPTIRKSTRRLSLQKAEEREKKRQLEESKKKPRASKTKSHKVYSQEELLKEAKITEAKNIASLQVLMQLEELNKAQRQRKKPVLTGPRVIFHSNNKGDFVTFSQELPSFFNAAPPTLPPKRTCTVTGEPAKYYDPITNQSFASQDAFNAIRENPPRKRKKIFNVVDLLSSDDEYVE